MSEFCFPSGIPNEAHFSLLSMCSTDAQSCDKLPPLLRAAAWGFEDIIAQMIEAGANLAETDTKGETALHKAARFAHLPIAARLLRKGIKVNAKDALGMTALHWAAIGGNVQMTRLLLLHHADPDARDHYAGGMTPGEMAQLMGHDVILDVVERYRWVNEAV